MKKTIILFVTTLIFGISYGQETSSLTFGDKMKINSKYSGEEMEIWVKLPEDFEKLKDNCSILILLDGDEYFGMATNVQNLLSMGRKNAGNNNSSHTFNSGKPVEILYSNEF